MSTKMSPLFELDSTIAEDQSVYRIIDFFSACQIISDKKFMMARSDTFQDKNEGVERLLSQLEAVTAGGGCGGMGWHDKATALREHNRVKCSSYVSCWSQNPESVAMWSLYSPDLQSVRVSTKVSKLRQIAENLIGSYDVRRFRTEDLGGLVIASLLGRIAPVQYRSLKTVTKVVTRRAKAHQRIAARYKRKGIDLPLFNLESLVREQRRRLPELRESGYLKDDSFKHEEEIRVLVRLGQELCTEHTLGLADLFEQSDEHRKYLKDRMSVWSYLEATDVPERAFVDCADDFVETVAIDPRCPPHKAAFMRKWFETNGIRVEESNCFGYLPSGFDVFPDR